MTALETPESLSGSPEPDICIPVLETSRLVLRAPRLEDARAIVAAANDRRVAEMTASIPHPYAEKDAQAWIMNNWRNQDHGFVVTLKSNGALIGTTGFKTCSGADPEIGYFIGVEFWGRGYATEAARAVVDHLFAAREAGAVTGRVRVVNPASRRVLEKCGFHWVGAGLSRSRVALGSLPVDILRLDRALWTSLKAWRDPVTRRGAARIVGA